MTRLTFAKVLIVSGAVIGIVPLAVLFSVPLYSTGLFLLWGTSMDQKRKFAWTFIPLFVIIAVWIAITGTSKLLSL